MLIPFTDEQGRETWINPIHVKVVRSRKGILGGDKGTEVWFSFNGGSEAIYFTESVATIAAALNAGMPSAIVLDSSEDDTHMPPPTTPGA
jgi:hypothetical protein